jgi:hypothetical protein
MANSSEWARRQELAEGVRFELTREQSPLPVFKTGALNHSATLPSLIHQTLTLGINESKCERCHRIAIGSSANWVPRPDKIFHICSNAR